ncbi:MAG: hypothetical protein LBV49_04265 [Azonexus sp.]|jgi:hypothetical protein|nr:hypothetical protein [Azonexus sp.]
MIFTENGTTGHPALALIAIRSRKIADGNGCGKYMVVEPGYIRAFRLVPYEASGRKAMRRELINIVQRGGGNWSKNWRIAEGTAESTAEEKAIAAAQEAARAEQEAITATLPWYSVVHTTDHQGGDRAFYRAEAICEKIDRRVGERIGLSGDDAREALQAEIDALDSNIVEIYGIHIQEYPPEAQPETVPGSA